MLRQRALRHFAQASQELLPLATVNWSAAVLSGMASKILQEALKSSEQQHGTGHIISSASRPTDDVLSAPDDNETFQAGIGASWSMDAFDELLESNLDPSMPWCFDDLPDLFPEVMASHM
jgi:hypothetical protein